MVAIDVQPCRRVNIDISQLIVNGHCWHNQVLEDIQFIPTSQTDASPPFSNDIVLSAVSFLDSDLIPLWMFADMTWELRTASRDTNNFFSSFLSKSPVLPDHSYLRSILLTTLDTQLLITGHLQAPQTTLVARSLHSSSLVTPALHIKRESPPPDSFAGQLISIVSPKRSREASFFDTKLESPGRMNPKTRQKRRVENLLPEIAKRRKAELEDAFASQSRSHSRESSVISVSSLEIQTKEVVKQTVVAALRLHSIQSGDADYKNIISQCVAGTMFALRSKLKAGKAIGMGEIGVTVEKLLDIFLS